MKITQKQLPVQLQKKLSGIYLLTSAEPFLVEQARGQCISAAREAGFNETTLLHVEAGFDWQQLIAALQAGSLFSPKTLIDCRLGNHKPTDVGKAAIKTYCEHLHPDCICIISAGKLDSAASRSVWVKSIEKAGTLVTLWPPRTHELPGWLQAQAKSLSLHFAPGCFELIADFSAGNLLAARQTLEKCRLLGESRVSLDDVRAMIADASQYDVFTLVDTAVAGNLEKTQTILKQLFLEGTEPTLILWALTREVRTLAALQFAISNGQALSACMQKHGIWDTRKPLITRALKRLPQNTLYTLLQLAQQTDTIIKGVNPGNVKTALMDCYMQLAGNPCLGATTPA